MLYFINKKTQCLYNTKSLPNILSPQYDLFGGNAGFFNQDSLDG